MLDVRRSRVPSLAAALLVIGVERRFHRAGMFVTERDVMMHEIADRLHQRPAFRNFSK